jgi:hypothetical protein
MLRLYRLHEKMLSDYAADLNSPLSQLRQTTVSGIGYAELAFLNSKTVAAPKYFRARRHHF